MIEQGSPCDIPIQSTLEYAMCASDVVDVVDLLSYLESFEALPRSLEDLSQCICRRVESVLELMPQET